MSSTGLTKSFKQLVLKSSNPSVSIFKLGSQLFTLESVAVELGELGVAASFCAPSVRNSSKTVGIEVTGVIPRANQSGDTPSAQKLGNLRPNSKIRLQGSMGQGDLEENSQRNHLVSEAFNIDNLTKTHKKRVMTKSSVVDSTNPALGASLMSSTLKSSELLSTNSISAHHLIQLTRGSKVASGKKKQESGAYWAEIRKQPQPNAESFLKGADQHTKQQVRQESDPSAGTLGKPSLLQNGEEHKQLNPKHNQSTNGGHDEVSSNEKLRGFISSVDLRLHRDFFNFQPVVPVEDLNSPAYPYLPPTSKAEYTLVLDLDETLIHFDEHSRQVWLRPNVQAFLTGVAQFYELVIFTAAVQRVDFLAEAVC